MSAPPEPAPRTTASVPEHPSAVLAASRDALFEVNLLGRITWAVDPAGVLPEIDLRGAALDELFEPVDAAALLSCLHRLQPDEFPGTPDPSAATQPDAGELAACDPYVARMAVAGGQVRQLEVVLHPVRDPSTGALVGGVGSIRDSSTTASLLAELQAERRRTAAMFAGHDAVMLMVDPEDGSVVDANEAASRFYGYQRGELTGLRITDLNLLPPDQVHARMAQARSGSTNAFVFPHRLADGSVRQVEVHSSPIVDETGRTVLFSIIRDVTEEMVATAERDLMTTRYHRLASMASDVVAEGDNDGLLRWISESVSRVLGFPADTLVGRPFLDLVHPDDRAATRAAQAEVRGGEEASFQARLETRTGGYRLMSIQLRPVRDESGAVVGRVAGWRDITEAAKTRAEIEEREALLSQVLDGTTDAVMLTRPGRPLWVSPSFTETFGWRPEDLYDNPMVLVPVAARSSYRAQWEQVQAARLTRADHRLEVVCADGSRRWVDSRSRIVWTAQGELSRIVSSLRDVTGQVALEEQYRNLAESASDVVYRTGERGFVEWISPSVTRTLGWPVEHVVGRPARDLLHPDDRQLVRLARDAALAAGDDMHQRVRLRTADGGYRWMRASSRPLHLDGLVVAWLTALQDIDDEVRAEQALRDSEALLKASLERLLDPHIYVVAVRDEQGAVRDFRHVLVNDAACRYLRMERGEVIGRTIREVLSGPGVDTLVEWLRTALAAGALLVDAQPMFSPTRASLRLFDVRAAQVGDGVTFTWRDVTERYS